MTDFELLPDLAARHRTRLLVGILGLAWNKWRREGDDPELTDSPSILMAGPPAEMTPALATVVRQGQADQHTINTVLAELASNGRIAFHNLGGISNVTYVAPGHTGNVLAFDTGPANIWIDAAVAHFTDGRQKMDEGGKIGKGGRIDIEGVKKCECRALPRPI